MKVAIVGASGAVGQEFLRVLEERNFPIDELVLFGSPRSAGSTYTFRGKEIAVKLLQHNDDFKGIDIAFTSAGAGTSKEYADTITKYGAIMIDNSSAFRMDEDVPLVVPEVNAADALVRPRGIIANPNCTTIQVAIALDCLKSLVPNKATVATYQAVSGAGREGLADLAENRSYGKLRAFAHPIANNVIPLVGSVTESGYSTEEIKMQNECAKILDADIVINCFCARVPVTVGHSAFVNVQFERPFTIEQVASLLQKGCDILTFDNNLLPMPMGVRGSKYVGVGRIVRDQTANGINMFVVADNVLRGASYNAYEILQRVLEGENE